VSWHARGSYLDLDGGRAHYVDVGRGPVVLLLHGYLHSSWTWRKTIGALSRRYRVIAPCLPGFGWGERGQSEFTLDGFATFVVRLLDAVGVERLHAAVGNSLGGGILLELALRHPERFQELVLVSPLCAPLRVPGLPLRLLGLRAFKPLFRATAGNPAFVKRALALTAYRGREVDEEILFGFSHLGREGSHRAAIETASQLWRASASLSKRVGDLAAPVTLVWGRHDRLLPLRYGKKVARLIPGARLRVFEGCGHCPQEEAPERFNALLAGQLAAGGALQLPTPTPAPDARARLLL
jgi:pimeloyl-ACP methyl ester carboxylesterase